MKLIELLEAGIKTQDIVSNVYLDYSIAYSKKTDCFIKCDKLGKALKNELGECIKVVLTKNMLMDEDWYLDIFVEVNPLLVEALNYHIYCPTCGRKV